MAQTASEVRVAGSGGVWLAPEGTALPTGLAAPSGTFVELGYMTEDGVTITRSRESDDLPVWQSNEPVRTLITGASIEIAFTMRQFSNPANLKEAFGGGTFTSGATFGTFVLPIPSDIAVRAMVVDAVDGDVTTRFLFERVQVAGDIEIPLNAQDAQNLPVTFKGLASTNPPKIISNATPFLT